MVPYADRRRVILTNVRNGSVLRGRDQIIYAEVRDAETKELLISATLKYILEVSEGRGYHFVEQDHER